MNFTIRSLSSLFYFSVSSLISKKKTCQTIIHHLSLSSPFSCYLPISISNSIFAGQCIFATIICVTVTACSLITVINYILVQSASKRSTRYYYKQHVLIFKQIMVCLFQRLHFQEAISGVTRTQSPRSCDNKKATIFLIN